MHEPGALTYVVLEIPEPQASAVMAIRQAHADTFRSALPVEITLTDSFDPTQDPDEAFAALDRVAAETPPIQTSLDRAHRFPDSDTFVMRLAAEERFHALRQRILGAGLKFEQPSGYEFIPHCTLRTRSPVSQEEAAALLSTEIQGPITLDTVSIYTLTRATNPAGVESHLRYQTPLVGPS